MEDSDFDIIESISRLLNDANFSPNECELLLPKLNTVVQKSSQNEEYRHAMSSSERVWRLLSRCGDPIENVEHIEASPERRFWYLRTLRGVVLLARNLSTSNQDLPQSLLLAEKLVRRFNALTISKNYEHIELSLYSMLCELLFNLSRISVVFDKASFNDTMTFLLYPFDLVDKEPILIVYAMYLRNLSGSEEFLYYFLKSEAIDKVLGYFVRELLASNVKHSKDLLTEESDLENLSKLETIEVSTFTRIVCHESFGPFLEHFQSSQPRAYFDYLKMAQLVITSSSAWDKFQLMGIMAWCFRVFESAVRDVEQYFALGTEDEGKAAIIHHSLSICLDIISTLSQFEHVRKFIISYKGVELLVKLLHVLQQNLLRVNMLKQGGNGIQNMKVTNMNGEKITSQTILHSRIDFETGKIKSTNFPECKILIIETLGFLTYKNKEIQDMLRNLQALELVLSNCVIDDNDPFIKERSIMCIKFLLDENSENQQFVAQLEAKQAVQDDTLAAAGYELNVNANGKLELGPKRNVIN